MSDNVERVGVFAQVAVAIAAVLYPIVKLVDRQMAKRYAAPAEAAEARLIARFAELEQRLARLERQDPLSHRPA